MNTANEPLRCVWVNLYGSHEDRIVITDRSWTLDEATQRSIEQARDGWQLLARRKITEGDFDE
jgi:hypothetical protein